MFYDLRRNIHTPRVCSRIGTYSRSWKNFQSDVVGDTLAQRVAVVTPSKEVGKLMDVGRVLAAHGSLVHPWTKEYDRFRIARMLISPPHMRDAYRIRHVDVNLRPKGCHIQLKTRDTLHLFVRAFHYLKKGGVNCHFVLINLYISATRDELPLRYDLLIRDRTGRNRSISLHRKHDKEDRDRADTP